jgi:hypothetical protein
MRRDRTPLNTFITTFGYPPTLPLIYLVHTTQYVDVAVRMFDLEQQQFVIGVDGVLTELNSSRDSPWVSAVMMMIK